MPVIRKFLDLSTAHLPQHIMNGPLNSFENVVAYDTQYGALLWVPDDPQESNDGMDESVPAEVLAVQLYARSLGCDYVLFDRDADTDDALPTWDW